MNRFIQFEKTLAVSLLVVVVVTLAAQVIARYVFQSPISWSEEIARLALIWLSFVASGFVTAEQGHITVDLVPSRFGPRVTKSLDRIAGLVVLTTCLMLLVGGFRFVWRVWPVHSPSAGVSMSLWYGAASFGSALMAFHTAARLLNQSTSSAAVSRAIECQPERKS